MHVSAWGALLGLALAIFLIIKKTVPAYALIAGAFVGGILGCFNIEFTVKEMIAGVQGISPAILRVLTAGVLAGVLVKSGAADSIALKIIERLGRKSGILALVLASFLLTACGVFVDVAVLTVAPVALVLGSRSSFSRIAILIALIGGGKSGNVISPNPNTIAAAETFGSSLTQTMYVNIPAAIAGIVVTIFVARFLISRGEAISAAEDPAHDAKLPSFAASISGPVAAIALLLMRPLFSINIDPLIALPAGGIVCALCTGKIKDLRSQVTYGLEKMSGVAILLIGTGTLAGIIKVSTLKDQILFVIDKTGISSLLIAPISGALMSGASASTTAGATIAAATFAGAVKAAGISAVWGAAMTNAGAVVLDHLPHGSFFHVSAGSVSMDFKTRLKLIPYETLIGGCIAGMSTLTCKLAMMYLSAH